MGVIILECMRNCHRRCFANSLASALRLVSTDDLNVFGRRVLTRHNGLCLQFHGSAV